MSLIVNDDFITQTMSTYLKQEGELISDFIGEYVKILEDVSANGLIKGKTADALKEFILQVESDISKNSKNPYDLGKVASRYCTNFVSRIDKADKDLY